MVVCICNNVSDREIASCVREGASSLEEVNAQVGICNNCGCCEDAALEIIAQETQASPAVGVNGVKRAG